MNAEEAAEALGLHRNTVQSWLREGRIRGEKVGRAWRVPRSEVERLQDERSTLLEGGKSLQAAGKLLRDLARKRWQVAEEATARLARKLLEARGAAEEAMEAGRPGAVELAEEYHERLDALSRQVDRLREAEAIVRTADGLHAEGVEKEKRGRPVVLFAGADPNLN